MASTELAVLATDDRVGPETSRRAPFWVGTLYFAEGLPTTVLGTLSVVLLKHLGLPNERVAVCVSGFMLPWMLRPLWSPLLELIGTKRQFVVVTQAAVAFCLIGLAAALAFPGAAATCVVLF